MRTMPELNLKLAAALIFLALLMTVSVPFQSRAQTDRTPVPLVTLVPPTLVPPPPAPTSTPPFTESALAQIKARDKSGSGRLVVGILYNIGRFATLSNTGEVEGFEADIAQAIADDWGVKLQFQQVTRQNAQNMLLSGQIDLLMGEVLLSRDAQALVDYSDPLFVNKEVALVNHDGTAQSIKDLAGQPVGVVVGSRGEPAFTSWMQANGLQPNVIRFIMLEDALRALTGKQIVAVVGDRWELDQKVNGVLQGVKLLPNSDKPDVFQTEPYAIAMRRYDDNLRTLVNRTLQRLSESNRLDPIYDRWFPKNLLPIEDRVLPRVWRDLGGDTRSIADFQTGIVLPAQPVIARIKAGQPLRVAGLGAQPDANGKTPLIEAFDQALVNEMTRRWGVQVQIVPDSFGKGEDVLASVQADLAVGVEPHWPSAEKVDRVDFVGIYAQHSYQLMVPFGSTAVQHFCDLFATQRNIGYFAEDPAAPDLANKLATSCRIAAINAIRLQTDQDVLDRLVTNHTVNAVFGDSLRLIPLAQSYPKYVQIPDGQYGPAKPISFAVPRNDADFRVLVEATLQDMYRDGTYQKIYQANFGVGNPLSMVIWPGSSTLFGVKTSG